jgi:hypothetical protein
LLARVAAGEFGDARQYHASIAETAPRDRVLPTARRVLLALAEGIPEAARRDAEVLYDTLRAQGVNQPRGLGTVLAGEQQARIFKGEPFEQAMMLHAVGLVDAWRGDWDNTRAAAVNAQLLLRDFADAGEGGVRVPEFAPALLMRAIAGAQGRNRADSDEALAQLEMVAPELSEVGGIVREGDFNTVVVVETGLGPEKVGGSGDERFRARTRGGEGGLRVRVLGGDEVSVPAAADVNRLAQLYTWDRFADLRQTREALGQALVVGGAATAAGIEDDEAKVAAVAVAALGAWLASTATVDTRHLDILPQRVFIAPVWVPEGGAEVSVWVAGSGSVTLPWVAGASAGAGPRLVYVRLPGESESWAREATGGRVVWSNDVTGVAGDADGAGHVPYVLGGRDVRTPTRDTVRAMHAAGVLEWLTLDGLLDVYRAEGIAVAEAGGFTAPDARHVLERGRVLYTPDAGSAAFVRLYGRDHPAYEPRSEVGRAAWARARAELGVR